MACLAFIGAVFVGFIILDNAKIWNRPRESRLEQIRRIFAVMAVSFAVALAIEMIAFQLLPSGGCVQQGIDIDCETLQSIIGATQCYCMGICPFMAIMSFFYLVQLVANILSAERTGKEKRKNAEL
jgi:hypothetical protein